MNNPIQHLGKTQRDLINSLIANKYIVDFGAITKISEDKKSVDVQHLGIMVDLQNVPLQPTITKGIEILSISSTVFQMEITASVGDIVLLLGTRDIIMQVADMKTPMQPPAFFHYEQENLKALLVGWNSSPLFKLIATLTELSLASNTSKIGIDTELIDIHNSVSDMKQALTDMYTVMNNILTALSSWTSTNAILGSPVTPNPATIALFTAQVAQITTNLSTLGGFLK